MRVVEAPALTLEPQTVAHAEEMFRLLSDPAIYEYENEPPPSTSFGLTENSASPSIAMVSPFGATPKFASSMTST